MRTAAKVFIALVALEHLWFLVLEMFLFTEPIGLRTFGMTLEAAQTSAVLAANQGLYNGFLAAGLLWSLMRKADARAIQIFFLSCVIVAAVYGGLTAKITILPIQGGPALVGLILVLLGRRGDD
ncbi:DUF1304 domain-containing protein [Haliangium sp.]|uniref:DUF1304 domain-containing protein n=1 Tax=Haliangium sp. TaxID=2663208 RepID=UPI003D115723